MTNSLTENLVRQSRIYQTPPHAIEMLKKHIPIVIAGVTASGKNALTSYITQRVAFQHVVTHTTRPIRTKEENGVDHWFVNEHEMLRLIEEQDLIETQPIHGSFVYGTSMVAYKTVAESGNKPLMDLNVHGIIALKEQVPHIEPLFILPPSYDLWMERLGGRDFMSDGEKQRRLASAKVEIEEVLKSNAFILVVNHEVDETAQQIMNGISVNAYDQRLNTQLAEDLLEYLNRY